MPKPFYYIKHISRKGLFCVRNLRDGTELICSASELYKNQALYSYFNLSDAEYIKEVALLESLEGKK